MAAFLDRRSARIAPHGRRANAYWFAAAGGDVALRLDLDHDAGRTALRWLPDGSHAVGLEPAEPLHVLEPSDHPAVTIPPELARVRVETAGRAVAEYVTTGQRPTCVRWVGG